MSNSEACDSSDLLSPCKRQKVETDNCCSSSSCTTVSTLAEGFKTVSSILMEGRLLSQTEKSELSLCSVADSILAGISTPAADDDYSTSIYAGTEQVEQVVASKSTPPVPVKPTFPNDHFDDISCTQLLEIENDAVKNEPPKTASFVQPTFPSTMWVRKSLALKRSLISAIKEVDSMTDHIKQLTKELQENNSLTSD